MLSGAQLAPSSISPNADGIEDVALIRYRIGRLCYVAIYFVDSAGARHFFRNHQRRSPGNYEVYWGGMIDDPQVHREDGAEQLVTSRVLPNGVYGWVIEAVDDRNRRQEARGTVTLQQADTELPVVHDLSVTPPICSPNEDGLDDHVMITYDLAKTIPQPKVYLLDLAAPQFRYPVRQITADSTAVLLPLAGSARPGIGLHPV